jgi:hypothetical protein
VQGGEVTLYDSVSTRIAIDGQTVHHAEMSDETMELKKQLRECKERAGDLQRDIRLVIQYRPDQILRHSQHVGDTTFNQDLALRSQDFVKRHGLKKRE